MPRKKEPAPEREKFEVEAVEYVKLVIPGGGAYYGGFTPSDATHIFKKDEAFALAKAVEEAARQL